MTNKPNPIRVHVFLYYLPTLILSVVLGWLYSIFTNIVGTENILFKIVAFACISAGVLTFIKKKGFLSWFIEVKEVRAKAAQLYGIGLIIAGIAIFLLRD